MGTAQTLVSSQNSDIYQRLKQALELGLRRQIFVAVCDDPQMRDRVASQLQADLGEAFLQEENDVIYYPKLVNLELNLQEPSLLFQIALWLKQHLPLNRSLLQQLTIFPSFQILGIEGLTQQSPEIQRQFIWHLQFLERHLHKLDSNLVFWLTRPWLVQIKQSVPEFWRWHTGVFEFEAEPTPVSSVYCQDTVQELPLVMVTEEETPEQEETSKIPVFASYQSYTESATQTNFWQEEASFVSSQLPLSQDNSFRQQLSSEEKVTSLKDSLAVLPLPLLNSLEDVEKLQQSYYPSEAIAAAYLQLGQSYRDRVAQGTSSVDYLNTAIQAYERGCQWLEEDSQQGVEVFNDLGNLYWMRSRHASETQDKIADLEYAIQSYHKALTQFTPEFSHSLHNTIHSNLGAIYSDLACHTNTADNLQHAICSYEESLRYCSRETDALKYGSTQNNLGTAYWHLAQRLEPVKNLTSAIDAYQEALSQHLPEDSPLEWAMIQNNIATAYWNLAQHQRPESCYQLAIEAYNQALRYRTPKTAPEACAVTHNNLGTTYWHLAEQFAIYPQIQQQYLQRAINAYDRATTLAQDLLNQSPPVTINFDLLTSYNNLGLIHYQLATDSKFNLVNAAKLAHLEAALYSHLQVLVASSSHPEMYQTAFKYLVKAVRGFYAEGGVSGQNAALSKLPGQLIPEILPYL